MYVCMYVLVTLCQVIRRWAIDTSVSTWIFKKTRVEFVTLAVDSITFSVTQAEENVPFWLLMYSWVKMDQQEPKIL